MQQAANATTRKYSSVGCFFRFENVSVVSCCDVFKANLSHERDSAGRRNNAGARSRRRFSAIDRLVLH